MILRPLLLLTSLVMIAVMTLSAVPRTAYANKVDCGKVMTEVAAGKKAKDIASDLKISTSSVYRCKKKAKTEAKSGMTPSPVASPTKPK
ncbi:MAG TPA: helix-turn-helix domain-containing protein [Candidatus Binataceae bacterium]|nr:helix-turn-helix domain-containing protein [Candidatus Binataceae bacterium]